MTELFKIVVKERLIVWDLLGNPCLLSRKDYFIHFFFSFYQWHYSFCSILLLVPQLFSQIWTTTSIKFINWNLNKKALMEKCQFNVFSQISRLTEIILERDANEHYKYFRVPSKDNPTRPTLLHLAAEQNFLHVTKSLVDQYPGLMYLWTKEQDDMPSYLPVELALKKYKDDTAAFLVSRMRHDR